VIIATPSPTGTQQVQEKDPEPHKLTETQKLQNEHTNAAGHDDYYIEGDVLAVNTVDRPPTVTIGTRDGPVVVVMLCGDQCPKPKVGDYLEAGGEKQSEVLFWAYDAHNISRP